MACVITDDDSRAAVRLRTSRSNTILDVRVVTGDCEVERHISKNEREQDLDAKPYPPELDVFIHINLALGVLSDIH